MGKLIQALLVWMLLSSGIAQAELQTYRLTAEVTNNGGNSGLFENGSIYTFDYVFDTSVELLPDENFFRGVVKSLTFNGETSSDGKGNVLALSILTSEYRFVSFDIGRVSRSDGVIFFDLSYSAGGLDFNHIQPFIDYAVNTDPSDLELRISVGSAESDIYLRGTSFNTIPTIPEPNSFLLLLLGFSLIAMTGRRRRVRYK